MKRRALFFSASKIGEGKHMNIGFIGTGNMGAALIQGYLSVAGDQASKMFAYDMDTQRLSAFASKTGIRACQNAQEVAANSQILILSVKPGNMEDAIKEIAPGLIWDHTVIVSIAAGISIDWIEATCHRYSGGRSTTCKVTRVMPNTPALVGKGMSAVAKNNAVSEEEFQSVLALFQSVGLVEEVPESLMDCVTGVSGSSPAYVYLFIEALADAAVALGMARKQAYTFAAQAVLGSADMVLSTGQHPGELKDMVCSPGGTTIEAVKALEKNGFRNAVQEAVFAAAEKSKRMTK